ncbi:MAG TPA: class F sortase, partial [Candidatus Saccharimonadales bacterium]
MPEQSSFGLNNPALRSRLRQPGDFQLSRHSAMPPPRRPGPAAAPPPTPQPTSASPVPQPAEPARHFMHESDQPDIQPLRAHHLSKLQVSLVGMAALVFITGMAVSLQTLLTNHSATAQVSALAKQADKQSGGSVPSTTKPSVSAFNTYAVAPDLPRYLRIPKLGVNARVLQVGVNSSGALGTPSNVFDTAWYTGSAKPGQPGATLIDGHVSS